MTRYRIVETDNFGRDYPDESFVNLPTMRKEQAEQLADLINEICSGETGYHQRYWKVVDDSYELQPGFEP